MAQQFIRHIIKTYTPASVSATEAQTNLWPLKKGERLVWSSFRFDVVNDGSNATISVGTTPALGGGTTTNIMTATQAFNGLPGQVFNANNGAGMNQAGGWVQMTDGWITTTYNPGQTPGTTAPTIKFSFGITRDFPE